MARGFLLVWLGCVAVATLLVGALNIFVDPYLVFGSPRGSGFNERKPAIDGHDKLAKLYQFPRSDPRTVIIGSSRVELGLDSGSAFWPTEFRPVYNLGIPGAGLRGMYGYLRYALHLKSPRLVLISVEFESFLFSPGSATEESDGPLEADTFQRSFKDYFNSAFSSAATEDTVRTILANRQVSSVDLSSWGDLNEVGFRDQVLEDGQFAFFEQKNDRFFRQRGASRGTYQWQSPAMTALADMLSLCASKKVPIILFIQPSHVDRLESFSLVGLWPGFEQWKRDLAALVQTYSSSGAQAVVWDFSGFDTYSEETIPALGDRMTILKWFWEPVHYRKSLGELMLARMFGQGENGFGERLTPANVEHVIAAERAARAVYRQDKLAHLTRLSDQYHAILRELDPTRAQRLSQTVRGSD